MIKILNILSHGLIRKMYQVGSVIEESDKIVSRIEMVKEGSFNIYTITTAGEKLFRSYHNISAEVKYEL